jgi:hypothetical protein
MLDYYLFYYLSNYFEQLYENHFFISAGIFIWATIDRFLAGLKFFLLIFKHWTSHSDGIVVLRNRFWYYTLDYDKKFLIHFPTVFSNFVINIQIVILISHIVRVHSLKFYQNKSRESFNMTIVKNCTVHILTSNKLIQINYVANMLKMFDIFWSYVYFGYTK